MRKIARYGWFPDVPDGIRDHKFKPTLGARDKVVS
jgi:hypothetical protein